MENRADVESLLVQLDETLAGIMASHELREAFNEKTKSQVLEMMVAFHTKCEHLRTITSHILRQLYEAISRLQSQIRQSVSLQGQLIQLHSNQSRLVQSAIGQTDPLSRLIQEDLNYALDLYSQVVTGVEKTLLIVADYRALKNSWLDMEDIVLSEEVRSILSTVEEAISHSEDAEETLMHFAPERKHSSK